MGKSIKFTNDIYLNSQGVIHETGGTRNTKVPLNKLLTHGSNSSSLYSTQYLQLGYFECSLVEYDGWSTLTLLISSTFYGIQHWSTHVITIAQAGSVNANLIRAAGTTREFYYKIDSTNKRVYLYARCTGGNGFGHWVVSPLTIWNCNWVTEVVQNVDYDNTWTQITTTPELQQPVEVWKRTSWGDMLGNLSQISIDLTPYKYIEAYFCSYGVGGQDTKGGNALSNIIKVDLTQPSINCLSYYNNVDWRYGNACMYPDLQLLLNTVSDPYCFISGVMVSSDKKKLMTTTLGFMDQYFGINPAGNQYVRLYKIIGYK